jgi:hypothetical protein
MASISKSSFFFLLCLALLLSGCITGRQAAKSDTDYLEAQTPGRLVEQNPNDPLLMHMRARRQVDPNDFSKTAQYTKLATAEEKEHIRNLYLDTGGHPAPVQPSRVADAGLAVANAAPRQAVTQKNTEPQFFGESLPVSVGGAMVVDVRTGEHPGKTRIVLDLTATSGFEYDIDSDKNLVVLTLNHAGWSAPVQQVFKDHPLIQAYITRSAPNGGTIMALRLKRPAKVLMATAYEPNAEGRGHRVVLDIGPL